LLILININNYWLDEESDIFYISFSSGQCFDFEELEDNVILEFNQHREVIGIEFLDFSKLNEEIILKYLQRYFLIH